MRKYSNKNLNVFLISLGIILISTSILHADVTATPTPNSTFGAEKANSTFGAEKPNSTFGGPKPDSATNKIFTLSNPLKVDSVGGLVQALVEIFTYIAILIAVIMFIYVGFQYVVAASKGNASDVSNLHEKLKWLIVGVAIVISARVIIQVVLNTLQATNTVSPGVINSAQNALKGN